MQEKAGDMTHYETLYVVHPAHASRNQELKERFLGVLGSQGAEITHFEEWGLRDLAYPIQKQGKGHYNLIQFRAAPGAPEELERIMRLAEEVMRCLTVVLDEDVRPIGVERAASAEQPAPPAEKGPEASAEQPATNAEGEAQPVPEATDPVQS